MVSEKLWNCSEKILEKFLNNFREILKNFEKFDKIFRKFKKNLGVFVLKILKNCKKTFAEI